MLARHLARTWPIRAIHESPIEMEHVGLIGAIHELPLPGCTTTAANTIDDLPRCPIPVPSYRGHS